MRLLTKVRSTMVAAVCLSLSSTFAYAVPTADERIAVHARGMGMTVSRDVNYSDLDLAKPEDVSQLKARTNRAAVQVCRDLDLHNPWSMIDLYGAHIPCVTNAQQQALAQVPGLVVPSRYRFAGEGD